MSGATGILEFTTQPGHTLLQQGQGCGAPERIAGLDPGGIVQQLHQGGADLLGPAPALLVFEGMPLTITDLQAAMQGDGQLQGLRRPA